MKRASPPSIQSGSSVFCVALASRRRSRRRGAARRSRTSRATRTHSPSSRRSCPWSRAARSRVFRIGSASNGTKGAEDVARTSGELREAARLSAENPSATVDLGGDEKAPRKPGNPNEKLPSFDLGLNQGGSTQRSVEVGSVDRPVTSGTNMIAGVTHAADKVAERHAAGIPVPGKHDATIQVSLATKVDQKASGAIEISPNGDRVRVTKRTPPDRMAMSNIFDEFTDKIAQGDPAGLLDRVNVVDAKTGALLAQYDKDGRVWKRVR